MAISTYSELQEAVASWLNRSDLTTTIPDFITLAESRLNRTLRLRVMETTTTLSLTASSRTVALPSAFIEPLALWRDADTKRVELRFLLPDVMTVYDTEGVPEFWTVDGANLAVERPADAGYTLPFRYLAGFALSDSATTNWLLTNHPDAYLFATLVESAPYLRDQTNRAIWEARLQAALKEINEKEGRSRSRATLSTDPALSWRHRNHCGLLVV